MEEIIGKIKGVEFLPILLYKIYNRNQEIGLSKNLKKLYISV